MTPDTDKREGLGEGIYDKFVQNYEKLLEENKKLREEKDKLNEKYLKAIERVRDKITEIGIRDSEIKKLANELADTQRDLEHRDSFFSIMRDVLANEEIDNTQLAAILYTVVHEECGDDELSEKELEIVKKFWNREYV